MKALKPLWYGLCLIGFGICYAVGLICFGNSLQAKSQNELEAAKYYYWAASTRTAQEMYASIPWEARIEAKNNLLQAVCRKQRTKLCKEILNEFAAQVAGR